MEDTYLIINNAIKSLDLKLNKLDLQDLNICDHTREKLHRYIKHFSFFMGVYSQLLQKVLKKLNNPVNECIFVDYGGGCGILSWLAKMAGFKTVIYNDIYDKSVADAEILSKKLDISVDYFICGDVEDFVSQIFRLNIQPDLICSFDVLEHIYDLETWIKTIAEIRKFHLLFMTGANPKNPFIVNRLKKLQIRAEFQGSEKNIRCHDVFLNTAYLKQREIIISSKFPDLKNSEVEYLAKKSRGLRTDDMEKMVHEYQRTGEISYIIDHPTNTCDPYTGSWTERLIDLERLKNFCESNNLEIHFSSSFYCYSDKKILNIIKFLLNQLIKIMGTRNLFFSPSVTLEIQK